MIVFEAASADKLLVNFQGSWLFNPEFALSTGFLVSIDLFKLY